MKIPFKIGDKEFLLKPYCTKQEKEILLLSSFDVFDFDRIFDVLEFDSTGLTFNEKVTILYKFREISLGDEISVRFRCDCGFVNETTLQAHNFVKNAEYNDLDVKKLNKDVTDDNLHEFVNMSSEEIDDLPISEFDSLKERVKKNQVHFDFTKKKSCLKCKKEHTFNIGDLKYVVDVMSDDTLMTLYKTYNFMIFFGHYTKTDIDNMLPFERSIFTGLLSKAKEDLAK